LVPLLLEYILLFLVFSHKKLLLELYLHLIAEGCHLIEALPDFFTSFLIITLLSLFLILDFVLIKVLVVLFLLHNDALSL
jgi:hypothetical protein